MSDLDVDPVTDADRPLTDAEFIARAAEALNPQELGPGFWVADVGAAVEAEDGQLFTGACIGGYLSVCAEISALSQLVAATGPTVRRVVAVWRSPDDGVLHVIPPCGRCRAFLRTLSQQNLDATIILGPGRTTTLAELLPYAGWHAEPVDEP
ncbi:cytidine deaminase family protein [Ornithinimicrobium sp. Y1847]|uniref:cytidine deaminase family protein n=1 Tax=Ornithinimicrobium sp. Y1847 TaxID=3405419 RepID=UPI003B680350